MIAIETAWTEVQKAVAVCWTVKESAPLMKVQGAMAVCWTLKKSAASPDAVDHVGSVNFVDPVDSVAQ